MKKRLIIALAALVFLVMLSLNVISGAHLEWCVPSDTDCSSPITTPSTADAGGVYRVTKADAIAKICSSTGNNIEIGQYQVQFVSEADELSGWKTAFKITNINADGDGFNICEDTDDTNPNTYPGAGEVCDGSDNNGDGMKDEGCDDDVDDYCDIRMECKPGYPNYAKCVNDKCTDCYDAPPQGSSIHPGLDEWCYTFNADFFDNNCNGVVNEGCEDTDYRDCVYKCTTGDGICRTSSLSGNSWIGVPTPSSSTNGRCCGNSPQPEYFNWWRLQMASCPTCYSGCWDSNPIFNNMPVASSLAQDPVQTLVIPFTPSNIISSATINYKDIKVKTGKNYTLYGNITVFGKPTNYVVLKYSKINNGQRVGDSEIGSIYGGRSQIVRFTIKPDSTYNQIMFGINIPFSRTEVMLRDMRFSLSDYAKVLNVNGSFYGCDVPGNSAIRLATNTYLAGNSPAVPFSLYMSYDENGCQVVGDYYCSYSGEWRHNVDDITENTVTAIPETKEILGDYFKPYYTEKDCCPEGYCWDGMTCYNGTNKEYTGVHLANITVNEELRNYKCVDGVWQNSTFKPDQNGNLGGYCGQFQCYYKGEKKSICVESGNFTFDDYCLEGNWTTRTNLIALQLLDLVERTGIDQYTLFCDSYQNALNDYLYTDIIVGDILPYIVGNKTEGGLFDCGYGEWSGVPGEGTGCANNFCVLKYKSNVPDSKGNYERVVFGTSLNFPINISSKDNRYFLSFLRLFDISRPIPAKADHYVYCDKVIEQNRDEYLGCKGPTFVRNEENDIWYNTKTQSMIYSKQNVALGGYSAVDSLINFLKHPFAAIFNFIVDVSTPQYNRDDYSFIHKTEDFSRLYINRYTDGRSIRGVVETINGVDTMAISYNNIGVDICKKVEDYDRMNYGEEGCGVYGRTETYCPVVCDPQIIDSDNWAFNVETRNLEGISLWPDLTAKIRTAGEKKSAGSIGGSMNVCVFGVCT